MIHIGIFAFDIYIGSLLSKIYFTSIVYYIYTFCTYMFFRLFFLAYMFKFDKKRNVAFQELVEDNFSSLASKLIYRKKIKLAKLVVLQSVTFLQRYNYGTFTDETCHSNDITSTRYFRNAKGTRTKI